MFPHHENEIKAVLHTKLNPIAAIGCIMGSSTLIRKKCLNQ